MKMLCINWVKEQAYKLWTCCYEITEEHIPLYRSRGGRSGSGRYYGNLTPPREEERIDILIEEQPTIINIIDNVREDFQIREEGRQLGSFKPVENSEEDKFYDTDVTVASV